MLFFEASSETGRFRHLSGYVFGVCNFEDTKSMRVIFFFKKFLNLMEISKMQKKIQKKRFVSEIIASGLASLNCLY